MTQEKEQKICNEVAVDEFDRFTEGMALDVDESCMDQEDLSSFKKLKSRMVTAIENNSLIINDEDEAVYTPQNKKTKHKEPITFHERSGASIMATDGKGKNKDAAKTYAVMGQLSGLHQNVFANMFGIDIKVCEAIFALLMD